MTELAVSEVFGPTVQGEGPSAGRRAWFVRLGRCNLDCAWCDTPYTWDWKGKLGVAYDPATEVRRMDLDAVARLLPTEADGALLVVTGGEPMLQAGALLRLVQWAAFDGWDVEVETNGTREPAAALAAYARFNVSPKLAHSGVDQAQAIVPQALEAFAALAMVGRATFKFVVQQPSDLDEVDSLVLRFNIPDSAVWVMPEGRSALEVAVGLGSVARPAIERGWNVSNRLHVQLWGDRRGV